MCMYVYIFVLYHSRVTEKKIVVLSCSNPSYPLGVTLTVIMTLSIQGHQ